MKIRSPKIGSSRFASLALAAMFTVATFIPPLAADEMPWAERTTAIGAVTQMPTGALAKSELENLTDIGEQLFTAKFTTEDGAGRPAATQATLPTKARHRAAQNFVRTSGPDANACSGCHNEPTTGGAGDFTTNVFASEGFNNTDFDTIDPQFSNERGTNHLFGAGLIELLAREISAELIALRDNALAEVKGADEPIRIAMISKGISFGFLTVMPDGLLDVKDLEGIDPDLIVRPFTQKGVTPSLRQFSINAMNQHHGMQASERFGPRWTGTADFDEDGREAELSASDISALVAWQATLPAPTQQTPNDKRWQDAAQKGDEIFNAFGCQTCHRKALPLTSLAFADPGPYDVAGTLNSADVAAPAIYDLGLLEWAKELPRNEKGEVLVPLFGDLKRHKMTDRSIERLGNELMSQNFSSRNFFITAELWGVGSTAPYGHRNDMTTLDEIILAHGGEAREARDNYNAAKPDEKSALIAFLRTLVITP